MQTRFALQLSTAALSLAILGASARAQEGREERPRLSIEFATGLTSPTAGGNFFVSIFGRLPFSSKELGIGKSIQPEARVTWNIHGRHTLGLAVATASFSGDQRVVRETRFLDVLRLRFNERVVTSAELRQWHAFYEYRFDLNRRLSISPQFELRAIRIRGTLASPEARRPLEESFANTFSGPLGGVVVRYRLNRRTSVQTRFLGIHGLGVSVAEADAQLRIRASDRVTLLTGWKYSSYSYGRKNNVFDVQLRQPYLGVALTW